MVVVVALLVAVFRRAGGRFTAVVDAAAAPVRFGVGVGVVVAAAAVVVVVVVALGTFAARLLQVVPRLAVELLETDAAAAAAARRAAAAGVESRRRRRRRVSRTAAAAAAAATTPVAFVVADAAHSVGQYTNR